MVVSSRLITFCGYSVLSEIITSVSVVNSDESTANTFVIAESNIITAITRVENFFAVFNFTHLFSSYFFRLFMPSKHI